MQQSLFVADVIALINFAWQSGFDITFGETYRTVEQQKLYVQTGRSKTMNSQHLNRLAIDLNFFDRATGLLIYDKRRLQALGDYWESLSGFNQWGGNWKSFKDIPHFERRPK